MNTQSWIVVADEAIARILARGPAPGTVESVEELTDPDAHAREREFHDDAAGRRSGSGTHSAAVNTPAGLRSGSTATASAGESERHLRAASFARRVAAHLADAHRQKRFDELRIVAAPRFLGELRKALSSQVADCVKDSLDKDLVHMANDAIAARLFPPTGKSSA